MLKTLKFNRVHKNGWLSYTMAGVRGAVFVDKRMLDASALSAPPETLDIDIVGMVEPGADATEAATARDAKKLERERLKVEKAAKAAEKAQASLAKLQERAAAAQAKADAARAKSGTGAADQASA